MKKFIIKLSMFLLPIVVLAFSAEYLLQRMPNDYSYKKSNLDKHSKEIQILIFGSSHAYWGINPDHFSKKTFNASHMSQTLNFDLKIFEKYQHDLKNLEAVILPISYFSLFTTLNEEDEAWRINNYTLYYGIDAHSFSDYSELLSNKLTYNLSRLFNTYLLKKDNITCTELGWGTTYQSENAQDLHKTGKSAAERHTMSNIYSEKRIKIFEENMNVLYSFSKILNQRNIKLIFLTMPAYDTYRENLNAKQLDKMVETINHFVKECPNCYFFNWFEDADFVAKDFYDADHLNEIGAEKISKKLDQEINLLEVLK